MFSLLLWFIAWENLLLRSNRITSYPGHRFLSFRHKKYGRGGGGVTSLQDANGMGRGGGGHFNFTTGLTIMGCTFNRVARMGSHIFRFLGLRQFFIFTVSERTRMFIL